MAYDDLGRKISETNQMGLTRSFEYDDDGRLIRVVLPDLDGNPLTTGDIAAYEYAYDEWGNQTLLVDPLGRETRFTYDDRGRQLTRTLPLGFGPDGIEGTADDDPQDLLDWTESFEYDERGRQTLHVSFEGVVTRYVYDDAKDGRLAETQFFDNLTQYDGGNGTPAETVSSTYDAFGRMLSVTQTGTGRTVTNTYDVQGRLTQVASPEGILVYAYDALGRKTATEVYSAAANPLLDDPDRVTSYTYDALGRLKTVTEDADVTQTGDELDTTYFYDLVGNLDLTLLPNNVAEDYVYDELNRLDDLIHYATDGTPADLADLSDNAELASFDYTVRPDGKRTGVVETFQTSAGILVNNFLWTYDNLGRLVVEELDSSDNARDYTATYAYDLTGNRLQKSTATETVDSTYDANDRLLSEAKDTDGVAGAEETTTYSYDHTQQTGKTVTDSVSSVLSVANFAYDLQGRMSVVETDTFTGGTLSRKERTTYDYDASGIRVSAKQEIDADAQNGYEEIRETSFLVDHQNFTGYQQVVREVTTDGSGNPLKQIDYTFGHDEISQRTIEYDTAGVVTSDETVVFGHDGHGSVRMLLDLAGAIATINGKEQFYLYDAYGNLLNMLASEAATTLLYSGEQFDSRIGQQYLRARYYDPNSGRFNRLDPFFGNLDDPQSFHKYLYTHADPVNRWDPSGLISTTGMVSAIGIGATLGGLGTSAIFHASGRSPSYGFIVGALGGASLVYSYFRGILPRVLGEALLASTIVVVSELAHNYFVGPQGPNAGTPITYVAEAVEAFGWGSFIGAFAILEDWDYDPISGHNPTALAMAQSEVITLFNIAASFGAMATTAASAILQLVSGVDVEKVKRQTKISLADEMAVAMDTIVGAFIPLVDSIAGGVGERIPGFRVLSTRQRALVAENLVDISIAAFSGGQFSLRQQIKQYANGIATALVDGVFDLIEP